MSKDDKCLRETVLAELRRRRGAMDSSEDERARAEALDGRRAAGAGEHREQRLSPAKQPGRGADAPRAAGSDW